MFSKKILFPLATVAMASFVACGDDSSSSASNDVAPASVKTFMDIGDIPCSDSQNFCSIVLVEEHNDYYQCNGQWNMMHQGKDSPLAGCESATPAADPANGEGSTTPAEDTGVTTPTETTPAETTPAETTPAETTPAETTPAETTPAPAETTPADTAAATPAETLAETPAETTPAAPTGDKVGCQVGKMCTEGPAAMASGCSAEEGKTLLDACPAGGEPCDIGEPGITMYFYEGAELSCEDYKAMIAAFTEMAQ